MRKTQPIGFRLPQDLYDSVKAFSISMSVSLAEIVEKSLGFFKDNSETVLSYRGRHFLHPESSLNCIKERGIISRDDLVFIADLIQQAYSRQLSAPVTSAWVQNTVRAFGLLLPDLKTGSAKELAPYFQSTFPGRGDLGSRISEVVKDLDNKEKVYGGYADMISRCFQVLVRDGDFEFTEELLKEVKTFLEPWCFWVAKRALGTPPSSEADISLLLQPTERKEKDRFLLKGHKVSLDVFLSKEPTSPLGNKRKFSCGYHFPGKAAVVFSSASFYELLQCLHMIKEEEKEVATAGTITVYSSPQSPGIQIGPVMVHLTQEEFDDFVPLTWELYNREDVQADLMKEYVEVYGAL